MAISIPSFSSLSLQSLLFGNTLQQYFVFLGVILFGVLLGKVTSWVIQNIIKAFASKTKTKVDDVLVDIFDGPLVFAVFIAVVWYAQRLIVLVAPMDIVYGNVLRILITINLAWLLIRFLDSVIEHYVTPLAAKSETDLDDVLLPILRTAAKVIVVCVALIMVLSDFGFNVAGLIAGLGIGGLAVAFAAKDLISNMFGGISVIADKPFKLGDMIKFDNRQGTVREIGIRTTRIETLDGTQLIIPNAKFTDGIIENITRRKQHRVAVVLGLEYTTSAKKLAEARKILQEIAKKQAGVKEDCVISFTAFGASSVDVAFTYYITDLKSIPLVQDSVNTAIKERFEKAKISFAYPTQTVIHKNG
jgi:MscS family membrane protein